MLIPSGIFAWRYRSMPQLGSFHDDTVYWVSAQSLAQGRGYRIPHLPEQPAQTKYPPLYPALLALIWKFAGPYPENLTAVGAFQWSFVPLLLTLTWIFFRRCKFGPRSSLLLTLVIAVSPLTTIFATLPMSELPFTTLLLAIMLLIETEGELPVRRAFFAGILAAAAFLIRTNVIVLAVTAPLIWIHRRQRRQAVAFALPLWASIAGWFSWCALHTFPARDNILSYYTSYAGYYIRTFSLADLPHRVWVNFDAAVESLTRLVLFNTGGQIWIRIVAWVITAAACAGIVILFRGGVRQYAIFAPLFVIVLLLWQFPPDARFLYPILPLYVAGLFMKLSQLFKLAIFDFKTKIGADRFAAVLMLSLILATGMGFLMSAARGDTQVLPEYFANREEQRSQMKPVYRWISANTPPEAVFAAYDDALLYLNTGRRGYTVPILPALVYGTDPNAVQQYALNLPALWREKHITYVLAARWDFQRDLHTTAQDELSRLLHDRSRFQTMYEDSFAQVYRIAPASGTSQSR